MKYIILHESKHRIRANVQGTGMTVQDASLLEQYLRQLPFVDKAKVCERTGNAVIAYRGAAETRAELIKALDSFSYYDEELISLYPPDSGHALNSYYSDRIIWKTVTRYLVKFLIPAPFRLPLTVLRSMRFISQGVSCLLQRRLEVSVLDATAITASMLRGDFATASSVMFLLETGGLLEEWTHRRSVHDLAKAMSLHVEHIWLRTEEGDVLTDIQDIAVNDRIVLHTSDIIPLDGKLVEGYAMVNQSVMTGEALPVFREAGGYVYAGTVIEEGECVVEVTCASGVGKYDRIVKMIEESEKLKSQAEEKAFSLADSLVPYSLAGAAITWLVTRNIDNAMAFLMVDFSCALKLSMPIAVLSAMKESDKYDISVKGGKFLEAAANADTIVFDKTGTLTYATPSVMEVVTFNGMKERDALKTAACLEEHYPHSFANAIVEEAAKRGILHREMHTEVQYVVAHGISSNIEGKKAVIGSRHFVFEDEGVVLTDRDREICRNLKAEYSYLYMAIDGKLKAAIGIFDPLKAEAPDVINELHELGVKRICMLTGDNERNAELIAEILNVDEFHAELLPDEKSEFIRNAKAAGHTVMMVGDGVNDAPALSEADVGIAITGGAPIAREIADITISGDDLKRLVTLRKLSRALMNRIDGNYRFIITFNAGLIALGAFGITAPSFSALLHNTSTIVSGLNSMTDLLEKEES